MQEEGLGEKNAQSRSRATWKKIRHRQAKGTGGSTGNTVLHTWVERPAASAGWPSQRRKNLRAEGRGEGDNLGRVIFIQQYRHRHRHQCDPSSEISIPSIIPSSPHRLSDTKSRLHTHTLTPLDHAQNALTQAAPSARILFWRAQKRHDARFTNRILGIPLIRLLFLVTSTDRARST